MDAYQPPPPYMRPPARPAAADPYHQYYQHPARPPVPPPPQPQGPSAWYPNNQYHYPHSPSPPPPPPPQWGPPPAEHLPPQPHSSPAYPPPPPFPLHPHQPPFSAGANNSGQLPLPPRPPLPPPYPQVDQNWGYHQGHTSQANSNAEDWAVKAREWAAAKAAAEDQHSQSAAYPPSGAGEQIHQQYQDVHQHSVPGLSYHQFPVPPVVQPAGYPNYPAVDGSLPGDSSAGYSHQENLPTCSAIHQQEVPSSYSSVAGKEESSNTTQSEAHISVLAAGGPISAEQSYVYGDQTATPPSSLSDQPLQFTNRASSENVSLHSAWPPPNATGMVYPPIPSSLPSATQNPFMVMPHVSGHAMPPFGRFPPPNLQSTVQSVGPPYAFGAKPPLHPVTAFMDESYTATAVSERPKKAPVPIWLKEEILKNKAALGKPSSGNPVGRESIDDDFLDKPLGEPDQPDAKSFRSSKFTDDEEEEEEDEDDVEAARTAAINQEIKRILTEVLLKVTDELFDEIATKLINEDDMSTEDEQMHQASAKILVPPKVKESEMESASRKASSGSQGDVLGLVSYASDDDDDEDGYADTNGCADADAVAVAVAIDGDQHSLMNSSNGVLQQPKLPEHEAVSSAGSELEVEASEIFPKNHKSSVDEYSERCGSKRSDDKADADTSKVRDRSRAEHPEASDRHKDAARKDTRAKNAGVKSDSFSKDYREEVSGDTGRADDKDARKDKADHRNGSRDRTKQNDVKPAEKDKGSESNKKSTTHDAKKDGRDGERTKRTNSKEDGDRKREREKEEERLRHRHIGETTSKDKRKRSSPTSDDSSDDSRRKSHSRRRNLSPSPVRSRRRHVMGSPHSKHSQRGHSPYSSHDTSRGRESRSRSPPHSRKRGVMKGKEAV